eukprot:7550362-Heterocapsa_arctica.AAC.1
MLTKALNSARYQMLGQQLGLRIIDDDVSDNLINVLEIYRAPRYSRCTLRVGFYVEMGIQVTEEGTARWQCLLCDDEMTWLEYRQLP